MCTANEIAKAPFSLLRAQQRCSILLASRIASLTSFIASESDKWLVAQLLNKGSMIALFDHVNTVQCGGMIDLQGQKFSLQQNKGVLRRNNTNPLQQLPDMDCSIPVRSERNEIPHGLWDVFVQCPC
jgi:hypothetical protein